MKKVFVMIMAFLLAIVTIACSNSKDTVSGKKETSAEAPKELTIKQQLGETKVKTNPEKVVVFDFGTLDTLDELGIDVVGVPQASIPEYLSKYEDSKYENVGGLKEPDFEKIAEIAPDLIIISGRQSEAYEELSKIAPTIFLGVDTARYVDSFKENVITIGEIFGKEAEAKEKLAGIDKEIETLHEKATAEGKNALVILANEGNVSAYGEGSRFGIIHDVFGFTAVDKNIEVSTHGQSASFEYIAEKNPQYLFVVDRGAIVSEGREKTASAKTTIENDLVKTTNAYKDGHIVYLDPNYWYLSGGGLQSIQGMIEEVQAAIQ